MPDKWGCNAPSPQDTDLSHVEFAAIRRKKRKEKKEKNKATEFRREWKTLLNTSRQRIRFELIMSYALTTVICLTSHQERKRWGVEELDKKKLKPEIRLPTTVCNFSRWTRKRDYPRWNFTMMFLNISSNSNKVTNAECQVFLTHHIYSLVSIKSHLLGSKRDNFRGSKIMWHLRSTPLIGSDGKQGRTIIFLQLT